MLIGLDPAAVQDYISQYDPAKDDSEQATIFQLGTLDSYVVSWLNDRLTEYEPNDDGQVAARIPYHRRNIDIVRFGLRGLERFQDAQGNEIQFITVSTLVGGRTYQTVDPDIIALLPNKVIQELAKRIWRDNQTTLEEAKNSDAPSSQ